jgi:hypothetical protein
MYRKRLRNKEYGFLLLIAYIPRKRAIEMLIIVAVIVTNT